MWKLKIETVAKIKDSKDQTWPVWKGKFSVVCTSSAKPAAQQTE